MKYNVENISYFLKIDLLMGKKRGGMEKLYFSAFGSECKFLRECITFVREYIFLWNTIIYKRMQKFLNIYFSSHLIFHYHVSLGAL